MKATTIAIVKTVTIEITVIGLRGMEKDEIMAEGITQERAAKDLKVAKIGKSDLKMRKSTIILTIDCIIAKTTDSFKM